MIVDPDFLDHWRTRMLVDMLDDECAPLYVIRLWGHCHNRREWIFDDLPVQGTKAICRYSGDADTLERALIDCGFLERDGSQITMVGWDEHNASLITSWANGSKGGRPKKATRKEPSENPRVNPDETQEKPETNPSETDKIGLDKIGSIDTSEDESSQATPVPHEAIIDLYHKCFPVGQKVLISRYKGSTREKQLIQRWRESPKHQTLDFWEQYFTAASQIAWMTGSNNRNWVADFAYLTKRAGFDKTLEQVVGDG